MAKKTTPVPPKAVDSKKRRGKTPIVPSEASIGGNALSPPGESGDKTEKNGAIVAAAGTVTDEKGKGKGKRARTKTQQDPSKPNKSGDSPAPEAASPEEAPQFPAIEELPHRHQLFIQEYPIDLIGTKAAIRAGYSVTSARFIASELMARPEIKYHIDRIVADMAGQVRMTRDRVLSDIEAITNVDMNELVEYRRVCCRHCWGDEFKYQETPAELAERLRDYNNDIARLKLLDTPEADLPVWDDSRVQGYVGNREPNEECPECWGEGVGDLFLKDTRYLSRRARLAYAGTEIAKGSVKVNVIQRERMLEALAKHHKIYDEAAQVQVNIANQDVLDAIYAQATEAASGGEAVKGRGDRLRADFAKNGGAVPATPADDAGGPAGDA